MHLMRNTHIVKRPKPIRVAKTQTGNVHLADSVVSDSFLGICISDLVTEAELNSETSLFLDTPRTISGIDVSFTRSI